MNDQARISMDNNERAPPPGLYDPSITDQADDTRSDGAHRPQNDGVIVESGFNAVEGRQTTQLGSPCVDSVTGRSTNREAPRQYPREYITQGNRSSLSPAPSTNVEGSDHRAFDTEYHATSSPSLYPGLFSVPRASGHQPAYRPTVHLNASRPPPGFGLTSGDNRLPSASASHGTRGFSPGTGIFSSIMTDDYQHPPWGDGESEGSAEPQKEGQAAADARDRSQCATPLVRHTADDANNTRYMGREPDRVARRRGYYMSMARETPRVFDAGEADPVQVRDVRMAQESWAGRSRESGRKELAAAERYVCGREFNTNRDRALEDAAARRYAVHQALARARQKTQLERERRYAFEQVRAVREGQAQDTPRMDGAMFAQVMKEHDRAYREARTAGASRQNPFLTGVQTETQGYGPFDGAFFYEDPSMPSYRPGQPLSQTSHWRSGHPSPEVPAQAGGSEASRASEQAAYYEGGEYDRSREPQTGVRHHYHSDAHADQGARYRQPVDRRSGDIAEWVDAQSARMQASGVHVERPSDSDSEALDERNGETQGNGCCEEQSGGDDESLGAPGQDLQMCECGEDWESVTFLGDDELEDVEVDDEAVGAEVDDDGPDGRWEDLDH